MDKLRIVYSHCSAVSLIPYYLGKKINLVDDQVLTIALKIGGMKCLTLYRSH